MPLVLVLLVPLAAAWLPHALHRLAGIDPARTAGAVVALALAMLLPHVGAVLDGAVLVQGVEWMPTLGLNASLRLDGFALLFALLVLVIGLLVVLYARYYLGDAEPTGRFYGLLLLFMGAMLGVVLSENLLLLVTFWELTSLSSFLLIGYQRDSADARRGARLALAVTGMGGLALLAGILLIGDVVGSFELTDVLAAGPRIRTDPRYELILVLVLLGAFTKSAQFPFHFWLPHAMAAPTPVSAYLHSATLVKAGIFLLGRLFPALAGTETWFWLVGGVGLATQLFAAYVALFRHDLKGLLAYSTVSHLGLITLLFGLGTPLGEVAAVFHVVNHAVFKASLFMAAGIVDHETGTRDMRRLTGLARYMPWTATLAIVAAGAMAGVPLLNGFLSKEMFFAETLAVDWQGPGYWLLPAAATLAGVFTVAYSTRFVHDVFLGAAPTDLPRTPHEPPRWMKLPVEVLVGLCLFVGLAPSWSVEPLLRAAAGAVLQAPLPEFSLSLWHGFNLPLLMSVLALVGGALVYFARRYLYDLHGYRQRGWDGRQVAEACIAATVAGARRVVAATANGSLQRYAFVLLAVAVLAVAWGARGLSLVPLQALTPVDGMALTGTALLVVATLGVAVRHAQRLFALVLAGVVGLVVTLAFVRLSAPDLALTQLVVEVVTVLILLLALPYLGERDGVSPAATGSARLRRWRDAILGAIAGLGAGVLAWAFMTRTQQSLGWYFLQRAKPEGGGDNVVNVILVDFRGFDTLGEITVLAIAAVAIAMLFEGALPAAYAHDADGRRWAPARASVALGVLVQALLPFSLLVAAYLFVRGHNAPGGGFVAGLVIGTVLLLLWIARGADWADERLPREPERVLATGMLVAVATGLASLAFGVPFLTSAFGHWHWPLLGDVELASAMAFDFGILLVVVGMLLVIPAGLRAASRQGVPAEGD